MSWSSPSNHVWATGEIVTAANMNTYIGNDLLFLYGYSGGMLAGGYAASTSTVSGITTETTSGQAGMPAAVTVTVGSSRQLRITSSCSAFSGTVVNDVLETRIKEGSTILTQADFTPYGGGARTPVTMVAIVQPTAGSHTYYPSALRVSGTGTASWIGPSFILVEDIGTAAGITIS